MNADIIIVGAGLVGSALALRLSQTTPLSILLVDQKTPEPPQASSPDSFDPRVVALTAASQALLEQCQVWQDIPSSRLGAYQSMYVWDHDGTAHIEFSAQELGVGALGHIVEQRELLNALMARINRAPNISSLWGQAVTELEAQRLTVGEQIVSAPLIIATDGSQSAIRKLANFKEEFVSYHQQAIIATVRTEKPHQQTAWQNFLPTGPLAFLPLAHESQHYCSIVWSADDALAQSLMACDEDEFNQRLSRAFQYRLGQVELADQRYMIPLKRFHSTQYFRPGLALAGDAAHVIHPLAGQGVNLGFLDVASLCHEIERARARGLPISEPSILARYQRSRKPHNKQMMHSMTAFKQLFGQTALPIRWLRNTGLSYVNQQSSLKYWLAKQAMGVQ